MSYQNRVEQIYEAAGVCDIPAWVYLKFMGWRYIIYTNWESILSYESGTQLGKPVHDSWGSSCWKVWCQHLHASAHYESVTLFRSVHLSQVLISIERCILTISTHGMCTGHLENCKHWKHSYFLPRTLQALSLQSLLKVLLFFSIFMQLGIWCAKAVAQTNNNTKALGSVFLRSRYKCQRKVEC